MTTILVLDREWSQTGYLVVNLVRAGFDVVLASGHANEPWGLGRYCRMITAPNGIDDPAFIECLLSSESADIVLPVAETIQQVIWGLPDHLSQNVFPFTTDRQRQLLSDRPAMYEFARSVNVPTPDFMHLESAADLDRAIDCFRFPLVLRGTQGLAGDQVRVVSDLPSANAAYEYLRRHSPAPPFAQSFVAGQRCLIGGLFDGGRMLQWYSQVTTEARSATGPSIRVRSVRDAELTKYAELLFRGFEWSGLACAEFIRTEDGSFSFLEINPRPWAAIRAADCCGVQLMSMFANFLRNKEVPAAQVNFPADKEVTLFPAFIDERLSSGQGIRLRDFGAHLRSLQAVPWFYPGLLVHFLRRLRWSAQRGATLRKQALSQIS